MGTLRFEPARVWVSVSEAGMMLGVSVGKVRDLVADGELIGGWRIGRYDIKASSVRRLLERMEMERRSKGGVDRG